VTLRRARSVLVAVLLAGALLGGCARRHRSNLSGSWRFGGRAAPEPTAPSTVPSTTQPPASSPTESSRPSTGPETATAPVKPVAGVDAAPAPPPWAFDFAAYYFSVPNDTSYGLFMGTADKNELHLEARYQYEDLDTASFWAGYNFGVGEELRLDATLMGGVVAGTTQGVAPGFRFSATYKSLDLSSEGEYLVNTEDASDNYYYSWTEIGITPFERLRAGFAFQRTLAIETDGVVEPGIFVNASWLGVNVSAYAFSAEYGDRYYVFTVGLSF
jgi:hypothetical protein